MKALKFFRLLSMIAGLACFMIYCLPESNGEAGYDWMMIAVLVLFLVIGPASLIGNIKREEHPQTLTEYKKGYVIMCVILFVIVLSLCLTFFLVVVKKEKRFMMVKTLVITCDVK